MNKENLKSLANDVMFDIKDDEIDKVLNTFDVFINQVKIFEDIDTTDVKPLSFPYEITTTWMREDVGNHTVLQEEVLSNAADVKDGQIKIAKVVE